MPVLVITSWGTEMAGSLELAGQLVYPSQWAPDQVTNPVSKHKERGIEGHPVLISSFHITCSHICSCMCTCLLSHTCTGTHTHACTTTPSWIYVIACVFRFYMWLLNHVFTILRDWSWTLQHVFPSLITVASMWPYSTDFYGPKLVINSGPSP